MILNERVIVLRTIKHGDSNLIVHGLNSLGAKMNFFARGAAKSRKRFGGGVLEPTHFLEVTYKRGPDQEEDPLHVMMEAQLVREFTGLRSNFERLQVALYFLKVVSKISQQGVIDSPELFNLLGNALAAAETSIHPSQLRLQFELKLLQTQGVLSSVPEMREWLTHPISEHSRLTMSSKVNGHVHEQMLAYLGPL